MSGCGCSFLGKSTAVEGTFVGVLFSEEANATLCSTAGALYAVGTPVVVDVDGEPRFGRVEKSPMPVFKPCQKSGARSILREAATEDREAHERQLAAEVSAKLFCQERARGQSLDMKVSRVEFSLSRKRATVYFTAEKRVDFRQLVRDFSQRFGTRVQMTQVGARDEAKLLGGAGVCGRTLCCSSWLKDFKPISISMAKRQNLSLNPSKISGQCGRLLCCLGYEDEDYKRSGQPRPAPALPVIPDR